jgi:hypothetical protein
MRENHPLFLQHPIDGKVQIGHEKLTTPYHIYDGSILFIGGRANADAVAELLRHQHLSPILDENRQALVALWICDFTQANLEAHHELQISIFASFQPQEPVRPHPLAIYRLLTLNPHTMMICHGLWNNTERVVRYNQEHLSLDARLCESTFEINRSSGHWRFQFDDAEDQHPLITGNITLPPKQPLSMLWQMSRHLGLRGLASTMNQPFIHVPVVNTLSQYATRHRIAHTYTKSDQQAIFPFDHTSNVTIHTPHYQGIHFQPDFVQYNSGVRFVYLRPELPKI